MKRKKNLHLHSRIARHESPHLHNSVEFIYLTERMLELEWARNSFTWRKVILQSFPEVIHHCQVFSERE